MSGAELEMSCRKEFQNLKNLASRFLPGFLQESQTRSFGRWDFLRMKPMDKQIGNPRGTTNHAAIAEWIAAKASAANRPIGVQ
jgi:hypothetical protein